jgi:multidrug efflux system membrane fusion protein
VDTRAVEVFVYTVSAEHTAVKVPVRTLAGQGSSVAVEAELKPRDPVVVRGAGRLREGQALKVVGAEVAASWPR